MIWLFNWRTTTKDTPPRITFFESTFDYRTWLWRDAQDFSTLVQVPQGGMFLVEFSRLAPLPDVVPEKPNGVRIGITDSGKEVNIELKDMERHTYVIGMTGAGNGKITLMKTLMVRMKLYAFRILLDLHGDASDELGGEVAYFFDTYIQNFGVNPLALPKLGAHRRTG